MTKDIYVQARADHVASLASASPLAAIEKLIWNALDADAREVRVDLVTNALGGIDAVRVSDDGTGIDILRADETFGSLGGSWKREGGNTPAAGRRPVRPPPGPCLGPGERAPADRRAREGSIPAPPGESPAPPPSGR